MIGGKDLDESTIYICRAKYNGDMLPGKFVPARQEAYVSYGCEEHKVEDFEVINDKNEEPKIYLFVYEVFALHTFFIE